MIPGTQQFARLSSGRRGPDFRSILRLELHAPPILPPPRTAPCDLTRASRRARACTSSAKMLPLSITTSCNRASAAGASPACRCWKRGEPLRAATPSPRAVERASAIVCGAASACGAAERVDADDRIAAVVLLVLVVHRLFLDLAALVAGLHRAQHAAALGDRLELLQHRLLDRGRSARR